MIKSGKTFSITHLMVVAAWVALVAVGFREHWGKDSSNLYFWYAPEGLLNSLVFLGRARSFCRFVALLTMPWLIIDTIWRLVSLVSSVDFAYLRQQHPAAVSRLMLLRLLGIGALLFWLLAPFGTPDEIWDNVDRQNQLKRNLVLFCNTVPWLGLILVAVDPFRLRSLNAPDTIATRPVRLRVARSIGYLLCVVAIICLGLNSSISQGVVPALIAIATHSMEQSMPTVAGIADSMRLPAPKFSISNLTNLYEPLIPVVCCSMLSIASSLWIGRFEKRGWQVCAFVLWIAATSVGAMQLYSVLADLIGSQRHWFGLLGSYAAGVAFAVPICGLMILLLHSAVSVQRGEWRKIRISKSSINTLSVAKVPVALAVGFTPIPMSDASVPFAIIALLLCFDSFRKRPEALESAELELCSSGYTVFAFFLKWLTCYLSVLLSAITFGIFGIVLFTRPEWPLTGLLDWYQIDRWTETFGISCWAFLLLAIVGFTIRTLIRWRRKRVT